MKRAIVACAAGVLIALSGCGSSSGSGATDPAAIAPQSTLAYASFEIAPQGAQKQNFDAAFGKLLGANPEAKLGRAFTHTASTSGKLDYATDVKPWLGDTVSVVVTGIAQRGPDFALLVASTDDSKAQAAIDKDAGSAATKRSYRGTSYDLLSDGTANGVVDHFLVAGSESAFKAVVDSAKDGKSLEDSEQWKATVGNRADGKVGLAYVDVKGLLQSLASKLPGAQSLAGSFMLGMLQVHPFLATLDAEPDSLIADLSAPGTKPDPRGPAGASSSLIESMPADAWLAAAVPQLGDALQKVVTALAANPLIGGQYRQIIARVRARTGIDLQHQVIDGLGDVGVFVRGARPRSARTNLWLESSRPAALRDAVAKATRLAPRRGLRRLHVTVARHIRALPGAELGASDSFQKAAALIGSRPTLFVDFMRALRFAAASPRHEGDAHFRRALPHLRHIEYIAAGARRAGGLDVLRGVVGLR